MPLPKSHIESLEPWITLHVEEVEVLRASFETISRDIKLRQAGKSRDPNPKPEGIPGLVAQLERIEKEIKSHERLLAFARDERNLEALAELLEKPELAAAAARDPKAYARERGIELPPNMQIELTIRNGRISLRMSNYDELTPFVLVWTQDGFTRPGARPGLIRDRQSEREHP